MTTISFLLKNISEKREAEILLAHVLQVPRSFLFAYPEKVLTSEEEILFQQLFARFKQGEPVAYLIERQSFWSLDLKVTKDTLIPRPETELLIEIILKKLSDAPQTIADLGTGSGAIALSLADARKNWLIHATDQSTDALAVAEWNAKNLNLQNIIFHHGSWCEALPTILFDAIVSNPPYITENDPHLAALSFEPQSALASGKEGLDALSAIIFSAKKYLKPRAFLLVEHGLTQAEAVQSFFRIAGFSNVSSEKDLNQHVRATIGYAV